MKNSLIFHAQMAVLGFKTYKNDDITTFSVFELFMFVFYYSIKFSRISVLADCSRCQLSGRLPAL